MASIPAEGIFLRNVGVHGGPAPVRAYLPQMIDDVLAERINPGKVFDLTTDLDDIAEAYAAMAQRRAIKSLVKIADLGSRVTHLEMIEAGQYAKRGGVGIPTTTSAVWTWSNCFGATILLLCYGKIFGPEQPAAGIGRIQRHRDEMSRSTQGATCSPVDPSHGASKDR